MAAGRKRLAFVGSNSNTPSIKEREDAFVAEATRLGVPVVVTRGSDTDYGGGVAAARELLEKGEKPDAVFCANDLLAFGLIDVLRREGGLRVPEDVAVIGFDDVPEAAWLSYELTTFRQDPHVMAARAVDLLERRLSDPGSSHGSRACHSGTCCFARPLLRSSRLLGNWLWLGLLTSEMEVDMRNRSFMKPLFTAAAIMPRSFR